MARGHPQRAAAVGVAENSNSAVLVTVARGGELLDRRRIQLTDRGLPTHPHHHEGSWAVGRYLNTPGARAISLAEAVALVERVRASAARGAGEALEALAAAVVRESAEVYYEVQAENPHSAAALERMRAALERIGAAVRGRDAASFGKMLEQGRGRTSSEGR